MNVCSSSQNLSPHLLHPSISRVNYMTSVRKGCRGGVAGELGARELGGRCRTCAEWGRRDRIAFLMTNRSLLGWSDGERNYHSCITTPSLSSASLRRPVPQPRAGKNKARTNLCGVLAGKQQHGVVLGGITHFSRLCPQTDFAMGHGDMAADWTGLLRAPCRASRLRRAGSPAWL